MADSDERLDTDAAVAALNKAPRLQYRSALQFSLASASLTGLEGQSIAGLLVGYSDEELADARSLVEKIVSFGGRPTTEVAELLQIEGVTDTLRFLIETESEAVEALQEAIEPTGREGRSEALEHMLEHMIMRKQAQVDVLDRASRDA